MIFSLRHAWNVHATRVGINRPVIRSGVLKTAQIAEAVGVSEQTIRRWARLGLLPRPTIVYRGRRGRGAVWPQESLPLAVWIRDQLDAGRTVHDLAAARAGGEGP